MSPVTFDRDDITAALLELVDLLAAKGTSATIRVVGGAAIAISFGREVATTDIDAVYGAQDEVREAAALIAARHGWTEDWLNDKVKMFTSDFDDTAEWVTFEVRDDVEVRIAPADLLLAMKLHAGRGRRDSGDIDLLCDACGVTSVAEAERVFDRYYPQDGIKPAALAQLERRFPSG